MTVPTCPPHAVHLHTGQEGGQRHGGESVYLPPTPAPHVAALAGQKRRIREVERWSQ